MSTDDDRSIYRAIDDLKELVKSEVKGLRDQLSALSTLGRDVEQLKIDDAATKSTLHHHEKRITALELNEEHAQDRRHEDHRHHLNIIALVGGGGFGALIAYILPQVLR